MPNLPPEPNNEKGRAALAALLRAQAVHGQAVRDLLAERERATAHPRAIAGMEGRVASTAEKVTVKAGLLDLALGIVEA